MLICWVGRLLQPQARSSWGVLNDTLGTAACNCSFAEAWPLSQACYLKDVVNCGPSTCALMHDTILL